MPRRRAVVGRASEGWTRASLRSLLMLFLSTILDSPGMHTPNHFKSFRGLAHEHKSVIQFYSPCLLYSVLSIGDLS